MKSILKKVAVATAFTSMIATSFGANNQIDITAQVGVVTVVGFADVSASTADDTFVNATAPIDLGLVAAGTDFTAATVPVYVRHNDSANPVKIAFSDLAGALNGNLYDTVSTNEIAMTYTVLGFPVAVNGAAVTIMTAGTTDLGSVSVGDFVATQTPGATTGKAAGTYTVQLTVAVTSI